ncbi:MAG TPA: CoA-binding protein [Candidatus Nanoarchaeia archaeon]|nr:CoA-binding protein [Candidatus Nanoarchaeia archaeon]
MLLSPTGLAVIGASREKQKVGHVIFKNLLKSKVKAYPVNNKARSVLGAKCYKSIIELKGLVSHAVIAVPAKFVPSVIEECGAAKIKYAIIISAGFSETGNKKLEEETNQIAKNHGIRILGPNVLGIIKTGSYNASFFEGEVTKGNISFISQSGALGVGILDYLISKNIGLNNFISVGNMSDLTITDCLKEAITDEKTSCVMIYAESLKDGREFMKTCKESKKPIIILKAGVTNEGAKASSTHTGSLAGSNEIYTAALKQCGAIRVQSLKELLNTAITYDKYGRLGNKALVITNAGGPGILITDALINNKIKMPELNKKVIDKLNKELTGVAWSKSNPLDLVGDAMADRYAKALDAIKKEDFYDYVILILTPQAMTEPLETIKEAIKFHKETGKPVIACLIGGDKVKSAKEHAIKNGLITYSDVNDLVNSIKNLD